MKSRSVIKSISLLAILAVFLLGCDDHGTEIGPTTRVRSKSEAQALPPNHPTEVTHNKGLAGEPHIAGLSTVSTAGSLYKRHNIDHGFLPNGSAFITESGHLKHSGIKHILHAVFQSHSRRGHDFDPTLESIETSVRNAIQLGIRYGSQRIAVPLVGLTDMDRFQHLVTPEQVAEASIKGALGASNDVTTATKLVFVVTPSQKAIFEKVARHYPSLEMKIGSIIRFNLHKADAIVNPSNMEAQFKSHLSHEIAHHTHSRIEIEQEGQSIIGALNEKLSLHKGNFENGSLITASIESTNPAPLNSIPEKPPSPDKWDCNKHSFLCIPDDHHDFFAAPMHLDIGSFGSGTIEIKNDLSDQCGNHYFPNSTHFKTADEVRAFLVKLAKPSPTERAFYRYGNREIEGARVGLIPAFDFRYIVNATGALVAGKGIYVAEDPISSSEYAKSAKNDTLVTYIVPEGSPILMLDDLRVLKAFGAAGLMESAVFDCNPPVQVGHYDGKWWVLKDPKGVRVEEFDGRYRKDPMDDYRKLINKHLSPLLESSEAYLIYKAKCNNSVRHLVPGGSLSDCPKD